VPKNARIFVSSVTSEHGPLRRALEHYLTRADCHMVVQEGFSQSADDLVEKLADYIRGCDAVIHLVGASAGFPASQRAVQQFGGREPTFLAHEPALRAELGDLSGITYTQWEALLALHYQVPLFVYEAQGAKFDESQQRHRERLKSLGRYPSVFAGESDFLGQLIGDLRKIVPPRSMEASAGETTRPTHNDLPTPPRLFGRRVEMLVAAIEEDRIVVVQGGRGVGKTALALGAMHSFLERETFGALAWITASLRKEHLTLSDVLDAITDALDYPFRLLMNVVEKEAKIRSELDTAGTRCLLLLDNYEAVSDPQIREFLFGSSPLPKQLSVLLTVSGPLDIPADRPMDQPRIRALLLDELTRDAAAAMVRQRLDDRGIQQQSEAQIAELLDVVGGNPLAIEWVIGQMVDGVQLTWLVPQLRRGEADVLGRVFSSSWARLGEPERAVLAAMTIFMRPALDESLRATSDLGELAFRSALATLIRLYLVRPLELQESSHVHLSGPRFFVHPFTRDYLEGQRNRERDSEVYRRAATFHLAYVQARGGTPEREERADIQHLNAERENILGVLKGCWSVGQRDIAVSLVEAMARWLFIESQWEDLEQQGTRAVAEALTLGRPHSAARILNEVGRAHSHRSEFKRAADAFGRAMKLASTDPADEWAIAYIRHHQGEALVREKRYDEARAVLSESLRDFERIQSTRSIIGVRYRMATLALASGDLQGARDLALRGVDDAATERWDRLEGLNHRVLGDVAARDQQLDDARYHYQRALELVTATDMRMQATIELSLAGLARDKGQLEDARTRAANALRHFEKMRMRAEADSARRLVFDLREKSVQA